MPPETSRPRVYRLSDEATSEEAAAAALEALDAGELVVLPTETVYGVGAREDRPAARERLDALKGGRGTAPYSLAVHDVAALADRLAPLGGPARRIAERWWPGPVTQVLPGREDGEAGATLGVRVVGHEWTRALLARCPAPLLLPSANRTGSPAPLDTADLDPGVRDEVAVVVEAGRCALGEASTVVRPRVAGIEVLREGVVSRADLERHALGHVLVVCSGNTCRSPMGSRLLARALARRVETVPGYLAPPVRSAGTFANHGAPASRGALEALAAMGLELDDHRSEPLAPALLERCDLVLCMTASHRAAVREVLGDRDVPVELFDPDGGEVMDPFGGPLAVYAACARDLAAMADRRAALLCPPSKET